MTPLALPDLPRWIEAHGIAADPAGWRRTLGDGWALGHDASRLIVIAGDASAEELPALVAEHPRHTVLVPAEREDLAATLRASGRIVGRALVHTLADPEALPDLEGAEPLPPDAPLPAPLADELALARTNGRTIWSVWVDDEPVAFAYAPWRSARWFDVSVDVLPGARQLGLGTLVASTMIRDERAQGREPVWGADEANAASLRLARHLGFVASDALWVAPGAM